MTTFPDTYTKAGVVLIVIQQEEVETSVQVKLWIRYIALFFLIISAVSAQDVSTKLFRVKYLSAENVYINGGREEGLMVGDQLLIIRDGKSVAKLEIVYLADHSASCKIIEKKLEIKPKDRVKVLKTVKRPDKKLTEEEQNRAREFVARRTAQKKTRWAKVSGRISFQVYGWQDNNISNMDFKQPGARLDLKLRKLWRSDFNFYLKMRSKYNNRSRSFSRNAPANEWLHRVYKLSLTYESENRPFNFRVGRIITNQISGIGYIDGAQVEQKISRNLKVGAFAGTQPEWRRSEFSTDIKKFGGFISYLFGDFTGTRYEATLAAAGEYELGDISREFVYLRNSLYFGGKISVFQSMQLDVNRDWRKEATGKSIQLTNFYLSANYRPLNWLSLSLGYDARQSYRTAQTRSIPDSLFDDAMRQGILGSIYFRLPMNFRLSTNFTMRSRDGDVSNTYSYGGSIINTNLLNQRILLSLRFIGYQNHFSEGYNPSVSIGKAIWGGHRINLSYGNYTYTFSDGARQTSNQWASVEADISIIQSLYSTLEYEYNWGGDLVGHRAFAEIGYRF